MLAICEEYSQLNRIVDETIVVNDFSRIDGRVWELIDFEKRSDNKPKEAQWKTNSYNHNSRNNRKTKSK